MNIELELDPVRVLRAPWNWDEKTLAWARKKLEQRGVPDVAVS